MTTRLEHYIVNDEDIFPGGEPILADESTPDLPTACGITVPCFPLPPEGSPRCPECAALVESGAVS